MKILESTLEKIYGSSTRSLRLFNIVLHSVWFILFTMDTHLKEFHIDLPDSFYPRKDSLMWLAVSAVVLSVLSLALQERKRILFKFLSLLNGSMVQCIIAIKYTTTYPPLFDVMSIMATLVALWFVGGAFYVKTVDNRRLHNGNV